jgi:hypothetical protein
MTEQGRQAQGKPLVDEIKVLKRQLTPFEIKLFSNNTIRGGIYQIAFFLIRVINKIDDEAPEFIYLLPEAIMEIPFEVFRGYRRSQTPLYESEEGKKLYGAETCAHILGHQTETSLTFELVKFISKHFIDPKIPNPDLKEVYLTRLNFLLQFQTIVEMFEKYPFAQDNLVPMLLKSFDKRTMYLVSKNFLRFSKARGFKEISLKNPEIGIEDTHSDYFLGKIRE